ncbi:MAG: aldo/keto reductase, partial [Steroidobacterales bacterium]
IDTAEMYGAGEAERIVGAALARAASPPRTQLCIVSKVLPTNASRRGTVKACEASLSRLGCEYLDLYLLHWRGRYELRETLEGFAELQRRGLIRHFGVSNFDVDDLEEWRAAEKALGLMSTARCNQVHYALSARGAEYDLLPWQRRHGIETMAYSPLGTGALAHHPVLIEIARARGATAAQVALAWTLRFPRIVTIPKSSHPKRLEENLGADSIRLSDAELARLDQAFPPPRGKQSLATV